MKNILLALFLLLPIFIVSPAKGEDLCLIRLHVIANSDSEIDQQVKLRVRDAVLEKASSLSLSENAEEKIMGSLTEFEDAAKVVLASYGFDYGAQALFGEFDFPTKSYGNVTLPAGKYTAVRVVLGEGEGQNWWCVMYPPLCFTSETTAHFKNDDAALLTSSGTPEFKVKFKRLELWE